jgi:hypothetical protein
MIITEKKREEMFEAAKPLIEWLRDNGHPHCQAQVTQESVELLEILASARPR